MRKKLNFNSFTDILVDELKTDEIKVFLGKAKSLRKFSDSYILQNYTPDYIFPKYVDLTEKSIARHFVGEDILNLDVQALYDAFSYNGYYYNSFRSKHFLQKYGFSFKDDKGSDRIHHFRTFTPTGKRVFVRNYNLRKLYYKEEWVKTKIPLLTLYKLIADIHNATAVFSGYTHNYRDVVVVDVDETYTDDLLFSIFNILREKNIPLPTLCTINEKEKETGERPRHFQLQWYLTESVPYFQPDREFLDVVHTLNDMLGGDIHFTNGYIKNPFCSTQSTFFYSKEANIDYQQLISKVLPIAKSKQIKIVKTVEGQREIKSSVSSHAALNSSPIKIHEFKGVEESRHQYSLNEGVKFTFCYMNSHNKALPSDEVLKYKVRKLQDEKAKELKKNTIESESEINSIVRNIKQFCLSNYDEKFLNSNRKDEYKNRIEGAKLNRIKALVKAFRAYQLLGEGCTKEETARRLEVTSVSINNYLRKYKYSDIIVELKEWCKKHANDLGKSFKQLVCIVIDLLKSIKEVIVKKVIRLLREKIHQILTRTPIYHRLARDEILNYEVYNSS